MKQPVAHYEQERWTVALFGGHGSFEDWLLFAKARTGYGVRSIVMPPKPGEAGHQTIGRSSRTIEKVDGLVVPPGVAMAIRTKDCATLVAYNAATATLAFGHIGRHGLTPPSDCAACGFTTVSAVLGAVAPRGSSAAEVRAYITGSICGNCYVFDQADAGQVLEPFRRRYPTAVTPQGGLSQESIIRTICTDWGVPAEQIVSDGLCTFEELGLTSYRKGHKNSNTVVIIHHPRGAP